MMSTDSRQIARPFAKLGPICVALLASRNAQGPADLNETSPRLVDGGAWLLLAVPHSTGVRRMVRRASRRPIGPGR